MCVNCFFLPFSLDCCWSFSVPLSRGGCLLFLFLFHVVRICTRSSSSSNSLPNPFVRKSKSFFLHEFFYGSIKHRRTVLIALFLLLKIDYIMGFSSLSSEDIYAVISCQHLIFKPPTLKLCTISSPTDGSKGKFVVKTTLALAFHMNNSRKFNGSFRN